MLDASYYQKTDEIIAMHTREERSLIPIIQDIQEEYRYLPPELLSYVAGKIGISEAKAFSVASFSNPPLTTIHTPAEFMGEYAAHYILLRTKEDSLEQQTPIRLTLPCNLVVRNSCSTPCK